MNLPEANLNLNFAFSLVKLNLTKYSFPGADANAIDGKLAERTLSNPLTVINKLPEPVALIRAAVKKCTIPPEKKIKAFSKNDSITVASSVVSSGSSFQIFPPPSILPTFSVGTSSTPETTVRPSAVGLFTAPPGLISQGDHLIPSASGIKPGQLL